MDIRFFRSTWGMTEPTLEASLRKIKSGGFDGVEIGVPERLAECAPLRRLLDDLGLLVIAQQWTRGATPEEHAESFASQYERSAALRPLSINSHTGKDYFTLAENLTVFDCASACEQAGGVPVVHETHRGRALFSAPGTSALLAARPELRLAADFSHWCCVHESLLEDQAQAVARGIERSFHIHARVGHSQGPQVPDPRVPEWQTAAQAHLAWWRAIAKHRQAEGLEMLTVTPEFGPAPYMLNSPQTGEPLADLWAVNCYVKDWLLAEGLLT